MIEKIIHSADWHVYNKLTDNFTYAKNEYIKYISSIKNNFVQIIAGDFFHRKMESDVIELLLAYTALKEMSEYSVVIIMLGNHDHNSRNPSLGDMLSLLMKYFDLPNVIFLKDSQVFKYENLNIYVYSDLDKYIHTARDIEENYDAGCFNFGLYHDNLTQAVNFDGRKFEKSRDVQIFNGLDCAMLGHIHKRQELKFSTGCAVYSGSPYQHHIGESINNHGFVEWDVNTKTYKFIDIISPYNFVSMELNGVNGEEHIIKNQ